MSAVADFSKRLAKNACLSDAIKRLKDRLEALEDKSVLVYRKSNETIFTEWKPNLDADVNLLNGAEGMPTILDDTVEWQIKL